MSDTPPFPAVPQTRHRLLRGTELEHKSFVGMYGELTYDTTGNTVRIHDGKTAGGVALSKEGHTHDVFGGLPVPAPEEAGKFAQVKPGGGYGLVDPVAMSSVLADNISDAGAFGKVLIRAGDSDAVRVALGSRTSATGTTTIYVRPTGNDSNSGTSVAAPKKTIMGAFKSLRDLDARGSGVAIDFDGTFTENISINDSFAPVTTTVVLRGASAETSKIIGFIQVLGAIRLDVSACRIEGTIMAYENAQVRLGDGLELHNPTATNRHVLAYRGAIITLTGSSIKISGDARAFLYAHQNGFISFTNSNCAVDFVGTPTYSIATVEAYSGGVVYWPPTSTCTGAVTGKRVVVDYAGSVSCGATIDPRTVIPGTSDGTIGNGGLIGGSVIQQGWHMIGIPAMAFYPPVLATRPVIWTDAGNFRTWAFGPTTSDYYLFEIPMPPSWNGKTIRPQMCWAMGGNATAGNVIFSVGFLYQPMGTIVTPAWTQTVRMTVPCPVITTAYPITTTDFPAWDALNVDPSKPGRLFGYAQRHGADAADTAPGTAYLRGLNLLYQVNKGDDS